MTAMQRERRAQAPNAALNFSGAIRAVFPDGEQARRYVAHLY
jgi:hypothetical protein